MARRVKAKTHRVGEACVHLLVPVEVCEIMFTKAKVRGGKRIGVSSLGADIYAHFDSKGRIASLELLGDQPCMKGRPVAAGGGRGATGDPDGS